MTKAYLDKKDLAFELEAFWGSKTRALVLILYLDRAQCPSSFLFCLYGNNKLGNKGALLEAHRLLDKLGQMVLMF